MTTRRTFLLGAAATGLSAITGYAVAPGDRIRVAVVGVRGQGGSLLRNFAAMPDVEITHICDLDPTVRQTRATEIAEKYKSQPKLVTDYRTILDDKTIDALVVGTPDHWHALPCIHACLANKDVYVEKPDGHNIREGQAMVAAARKHSRMVQMGTQARSSTDLPEAIEFIKSGAIGKVITGKAWETDRQRPIPKVADAEPPAGIDYDFWLGPAPKRGFNPMRFHGNWRWFFDYGCGDLGNDGVHRLDFARWLMGITTLPTAISAAGGKFFFDDAQEWPDTQLVTYEYPGKLLTYEMRLWSKPRLFGATEGAAIYGDEGWILVTNSGWTGYDAAGKVLKEGKRGDPLPAHIRNFLDAVKSRKRESLNQEIESGHISSVLCHAGNIAWRTGKKLKLDPKTETFDDAVANSLLGREYRKGYELPTLWLRISVIVPALNEAGVLGQTLVELRAHEPHEVIVVDGGSDDGTADIARTAGATLLVGARGRAAQMNLGAAHATGDVLLFLHADCRLEAGAFDALRHTLRQYRVAAGCFRMRVQADGWIYRMIDAAATARVRATGLIYGDQGLFLTREVFQRVGGFPTLRLMEDVFISFALRRLGRMRVAPARILVSPRRWRKQGPIRQSLRNWTLTALAACGVHPDQLAAYYPDVR